MEFRGEESPNIEGLLHADLATSSLKKMGEAGEYGSCSDDAEELIQGGIECGATAGNTSMLTMVLIPHSPMAKVSGEVGYSM